MKTIIISLATVFSLISWSQAPISTTVESFETWVPNEGGELPEFWDGFNRVVEFGGMPVGEVTAVTKDNTDPKEGDFSVKLTNTSILGQTSVPGLLTTGNFTVDFNNQTGAIDGGEAITEKPVSLSGWFKYSPVNNDTALVNVYMSKNGDEIGVGTLKISSFEPEWIMFEVDINYSTSDIPDSLNIVFSSSSKMNNAPEGSELDLDAIQLNFSSVKILEENKPQLKLYPNPTYGVLTIMNIEKDSEIHILNMLGEEILATKAHSNSEQLNVSALNSGWYFVQISNKNGVESHKIKIQ